MASTTVTQPATIGAPRRTRPTRTVAFGKLFGMVVAIGFGVALVVAGGIGLAAFIVTSATD